MPRVLSCLIIVASFAVFTGCGDDEPAAPEVVVFTALDRVYAEPILERFEAQTGIRVRAKYDAEAAKTTGLINEIIARSEAPPCDVLWNNEAVQTAHLARIGLLAAYDSPHAHRIPEAFRDQEQRWTGFAARARVYIYNTDLLTADEAPTTLDAMTEQRWSGRAAIALPYFGTTLTHMAALYDQWGAEDFEAWLEAVLANNTAVAPGNGPVRDLVAAGEVAFGLTDTDDAHGAMLDGKPVAVLPPDADQGVILIPNTVALIARGPNPEHGKALIDYLLSPEVETALAASRSAQVPLGRDLADLKTPWDAWLDRDDPGFDIDAAAEQKEAVVETLRRAGFAR